MCLKGEQTSLGTHTIPQSQRVACCTDEGKYRFSTEKKHSKSSRGKKKVKNLKMQGKTASSENNEKQMLTKNQGLALSNKHQSTSESLHRET